ncbi:helix-turn-helix domain-containing protein [Sphingobium lactosutens]|uniref:helix-turn-helix domain-containing protein n=1 Tax=Sphingobium lactosutens TaxID=522773 RepID=UPI0015C07358
MLNWRALVDEAVRRRKAEQLTQRDLAALAGVSAPTIVAFERGNTRLRMDKAFDILLVLGLLAPLEDDPGRSSFVQAAARRWQDLVAPLDPGDAARQPDGSITYDHSLNEARPIALRALLPIVRNAAEGETGWPPFWAPTRGKIKPYSQDGVLECWLGIPENGPVKDPAHSDFWRISSAGQAFLKRGLDEDGTAVLSPGTIFDLVLPIWRTAEVLLHAMRLASDWHNEVRSVDIRLRYTGIAGRELATWSRPTSRFLGPGQWRARR